MSLLFMFPGQGAQRVGMLHTLADTAAVRQTLSQASTVLGSDCLLLDTAAALETTYAVQLCLLIAGVAMAREFAANKIFPDMVSGLSIGAYPAAVVAGTLEFSDAVQLVRLRAQLMEQAYPDGYGMAAINGLDRYALEKIIAAVHSNAAPVYLANLNAPQKLVIAGAVAALDQVMQLAMQSGATKAIRLAVQVPSHCPLFDAAAVQLQQAFDQISLSRPAIPYLSANAARAVFDPVSIGADLASNMARQVHWSETIRLAWERGARLAIEMPGGTVLTDLVAAQWSDGMALACDTNRLDSLIALAGRESGK